jgi:DNA-directed RNA polymerase specialized sigma24 family protein
VDDQEFTDWAAGCQQSLLRSAYLLTGDLHRAQDLVQEALVKVALRWHRLSDQSVTPPPTPARSSSATT